MNRRKIIQQVAEEVRRRLEGEPSGHDWWHVRRVWKLAQRLGREEKADMFVVELAALLHDVADWKLHGGDESIGPRVARELMTNLQVPAAVMDHVCDIIPVLAYKGAGVKMEMPTRECKVVQDADRLDALGAIGIARTFAFGGFKARIIYNPKSKPVQHETKQEYVTATGPVINHFYEKLLLLRDRMNTRTAKRVAQGRHKFMEKYLEQFYREWEGKA